MDDEQTFLAKELFVRRLNRLYGEPSSDALDPGEFVRQWERAKREIKDAFEAVVEEDIDG